MRHLDDDGIEHALLVLHEAVERHREGRLTAIEAAIVGGHALNELRRRAAHGDWEQWVSDVGLNRATAHRWRQLADTGLSAQEVIDQGGMRAVLRAAAARPTGDVDERAVLEQTLGRLEVLQAGDANAAVLLDALRRHIEDGRRVLEELQARFAQGERSPELQHELKQFVSAFKRRHKRLVKEYAAQASAL